LQASFGIQRAAPDSESTVHGMQSRAKSEMNHALRRVDIAAQNAGRHRRKFSSDQATADANKQVYEQASTHFFISSQQDRQWSGFWLVRLEGCDGLQPSSFNRQRVSSRTFLTVLLENPTVLFVPLAGLDG
jgi:hypothetical protein